LTSEHRVLISFGTFETGLKAGGPIRSVAWTIDTLAEDVITTDRDLGDTESYPGLSGKAVSRGRNRVIYIKRNRLTHLFRLARYLARQRYGVVDLNSLFTWEASILPALAILAKIIHPDDVILAPSGKLAENTFAIRSFKKRTFLRVYRHMLRRLDPIWHATGDHGARAIREFFPAARIARAATSAGPVPRESPIPSTSSEARFVFLSRISEIKNLDFAILAVHDVTDPARRIIFDIYGPVTDERYWQRCGELNGDDGQVSINYRGPVKPEDVGSTFENYDAFILPTKAENFGQVIAESLAAGCPVICSEHTPWTDLPSSGAGAVRRLDDSKGWSVLIGRVASLPAEPRTARKAQALEAYKSWQLNSSSRNVVNTVIGDEHGAWDQPEGEQAAP